MARSNLAYKQDRREQSYRPEPVPLPRPKLRTIEGQGRATAAKPQQAPWVRTLMVMSVAVLIVLATSSVGRIGIANATVQMLQTAEQTQAAIDAARAVGVELEVQHSLLNNPTRIQDAAAMMGVLPSSQPQTLAARNGFSAETVQQMQAASEEARAAELASLTAGVSVGTKPAVAVSKPDFLALSGVTAAEGANEGSAEMNEDGGAEVLEGATSSELSEP